MARRRQSEASNVLWILVGLGTVWFMISFGLFQLGVPAKIAAIIAVVIMIVVPILIIVVRNRLGR
jgi:hypothetical protein